MEHIGLVSPAVLLLQIAGPQLAQVGNQVQTVASQAPIDIAQHGMTTTTIVKPLSDIMRGHFGGSIDVAPPTWYGPAFAALFALPVGFCVLLFNGYNMLDVRVLAGWILIVLTVAVGGTVALTAVHNANRPNLASVALATPPMPATTGLACCTCGACTFMQGVQTPIPVTPQMATAFAPRVQPSDSPAPPNSGGFTPPAQKG